MGDVGSNHIESPLMTPFRRRPFGDGRFAPEAAGRAFITAQKWSLVIE
jgi:hypothetical protein